MKRKAETKTSRRQTQAEYETQNENEYQKEDENGNAKIYEKEYQTEDKSETQNETDNWKQTAKHNKLMKCPKEMGGGEPPKTQIGYSSLLPIRKQELLGRLFGVSYRD